MSITIHFPEQPSVKYFEIVRDVIQASVTAVAGQQGITQENAYIRVLHHLQSNSLQWRTQTIPIVPYDDPLCRIAYLYSNVPANANLVERVIQDSPSLSAHLDAIQKDKRQINVCALGGGPGTELLSLSKYIEKRKFHGPTALNFLLVDRINEWADTWRAARTQIQTRLQKRGKPPLLISGGLIQVDVNSASDVRNFGNWGTVFTQDLYILCYLISEIFDDIGNLEEFTRLVARQAPVGAKFLFVERRESQWEDKIKDLAANSGMALEEFRYSQGNMDADEQMSDLGEILDDVGRKPRVTWDALYCVGTKQ